MQTRYYDPIIGRFYSNDPADYLGYRHRGNPIHGFAIGFVADAAVQYTTTGSIDIEKSLICEAIGAVTSVFFPLRHILPDSGKLFR